MTKSEFDPRNLDLYQDPKYLLHFCWKDDGKVYRYALVEIIDQGKIIHVRFEATDAGGVTLKSKRYKVVALVVVSNEYFITFEEPIASADGWIESSSGVLNTSLKTQILVEEKELFEEFEGRFFVKILSDIITDEFLENQIGISPAVNNMALFDVFDLT